MTISDMKKLECHYNNKISLPGMTVSDMKRLGCHYSY